MALRIFIFFSVLLFVSCSTGRWMQGEWEGRGVQVDGQEWSVQLTVSRDEISINYPSLSCSGTWILVKSDKGESIYKEKIEEGLSNCDQGVEIHAKKGKKGTMTITYYLRSYDAENPIAVADMTKN